MFIYIFIHSLVSYDRDYKAEFALNIPSTKDVHLSYHFLIGVVSLVEYIYNSTSVREFLKISLYAFMFVPEINYDNRFCYSRLLIIEGFSDNRLDHKDIIIPGSDQASLSVSGE